MPVFLPRPPESQAVARSLSQSGAGAAQPPPADRFLAAHPVAKTFLTTRSLPPDSIRFTNATGQSHFARYQMIPAARVSLLSAEQAAHEIAVTRVVPVSDAQERDLTFTPTRLVPGIESADPMIADHGAFHAISHGRRHARR